MSCSTARRDATSNSNSMKSRNTFEGADSGRKTEKPDKHARRRTAAAMRAELDALHEKYGLFSDSAELIREDRDERG
jgi:hypothetical protein